jgi:hypothetical protein
MILQKVWLILFKILIFIEYYIIVQLNIHRSVVQEKFFKFKSAILL